MSDEIEKGYEAQVGLDENGNVLLLNPSKREVLDHLHYTKWMIERELLEKDFKTQALRNMLSKTYADYMYIFLASSIEFAIIDFDKISLRSFLDAIVDRITCGGIENLKKLSPSKLIIQKDVNDFLKKLSVDQKDNILEDLKFKYFGDDGGLLFAVKRLTIQLVKLQGLVWDDDIDLNDLDRIEI